MKIIILTNGSNIGDNNNALGIGADLQGQCRADSVDTIDIAQEDRLRSACGTDGFPVFIGAGNQCLAPLRMAKEALGDQCLTVWSGHQVFDELTQALDILDVLAVPSHVVDENFKQKIPSSCALIETIGVPHNLRGEDLAREFEKWKTVIPLDRPCLMVMMGGDAPEPDGRMKYYGTDEARRLGYAAGRCAREAGHFLIAANGPRTGKHDPATGRETAGAHRADLPPHQATDPVSQAFLDGLKESGISESDYLFDDFRFIPKEHGGGARSIYKAGLYAAAQTNGAVIMAGESTSMVTECCDLAKAGSVYIAENGAMNETHRRHIQAVEKSGAAGVLKFLPSGEFLIPASGSPLSAAPYIPATKKVALAVEEKLSALLPQPSGGKKFTQQGRAP